MTVITYSCKIVGCVIALKTIGIAWIVMYVGFIWETYLFAHIYSHVFVLL